MTQHYSDSRKIDPSSGARLPDGSLNDQDRREIGPTQLAYREWKAEKLALPDLPSMREFRWNRLLTHIMERDYGGILLFDPLNIRYATDSTNMQVWNTHNPFRAVLLCADGHMIIWDHQKTPFLVAHNPVVNEIRNDASIFYFSCGDGIEEKAKAFAEEIEDEMRIHAGNHRRLAVDKIAIHGLRALDHAGLQVMNGEEVTEKARAIKGPDEVLAMRCAHRACERAVAEMHETCRPGLSEDEIWAVLHAGNIKRGGEWIETRLLATGPRTKPWFQECGARILQNNEILAFDTDLVGAYGMCVDMSRTWWVGDATPPRSMVSAMQHCHEHLQANTEMLKPGASFKELTFNGHALDERYQRGKYSCMMHGVGLCDEWPAIPYPDAWLEGAFEYEVQPGMVLCVEALASPDDGEFSIKLEDQVLITEDGHENLTTYPFDPRLMGQ